MSTLLAICRNIGIASERTLKKLGERGKEKLTQNAAGHRSIRADLVLESLVIKSLSKKAALLVTEERGEVPLCGENGIVVCDPLDGSRNYRNDVPAYCLALSFSKTRAYKDTFFAYVRNLSDGTEYWADKSAAYCNGRRIHASKNTELFSSVISIDENKRREWGQFLPLLKSSRDLRRTGANVLDLCYLATGGLDAFIDIRNTSSVVHVPGVFIAQKAGAYITTETGGRLSPCLAIENNIAFIGAGNRALHNKITKLIK